VIAARHLGLPLVIARSCIDWQNRGMGGRDEVTDQCRGQPR
jgi:hypothetical protein